jgi:hypothetical protein
MPETELAPRHALKRSRPVLPATLVVLALLVGGGLWLWRGDEAAAPGPIPAPHAGEPRVAPADVAAPAPDAPVAPVAPADVGALLEEASANAAYRRWLGEVDLLPRWAAVTENLALGASPRAHLPFLRPAAGFSVAERGGRTVIAPASYQRYDAFADAVATLDARALARAYRAIHPALEAAYRALGYPGAALDRATAKALQRILAAPVVDGDVALVDEGGIYLFDDPALERLGEADKHLLRMGPRNTRLVQAKARELLEALGLLSAEASRR